MSLLLAKLALAPAFVVSASLAGRRWGPRAAGVLAAMPLVAGPILLIVDVEHGGRFAARAAGASLLGLVALAGFALVFARTCRVRGWALALAAGWLAFVVVALSLSTLPVGAPAGLALAVAAFVLAERLLGSAPLPAGALARELPAWDLPARAGATALLVLCLTAAAAGLGPTLTGVLTPFPIATSVLAAFVFAQHGHLHLEALLRAFLRAGLGFVAFCFLLAVLLDGHGAALAFAVALSGALLVQLAARMLARERAVAAGT